MPADDRQAREAGARPARPGDIPDEQSRRNHSRSRVSDVQLSRLIVATIETAGQLGYAGLTVSNVIERARVSRRTFYDLFEDREDCFNAAFEDAIATLGGPVSAAYSRPGPWADRVRSAVTTLLAVLDREQDAARLCVICALTAGPSVLARRAEILLALAEALDEGRQHARRPDALCALAAEAAVGGALALIHTRLTAGSSSLLPLRNELVSLIVLPYLGAGAALRELGRALPDAAEAGVSGAPAQTAPLHGIELRLTHRTLVVLAAVAAAPGCSNRQLAEAAGIADQGQASKLLARLRRSGLIENGAARHRHGRPNAWRLTERGRDAMRTIEHGR